jgi:hypothetical protein
MTIKIMKTSITISESIDGVEREQALRSTLSEQVEYACETIRDEYDVKIDMLQEKSYVARSRKTRSKYNEQMFILQDIYMCWYDIIFGKSLIESHDAKLRQSLRNKVNKVLASNGLAPLPEAQN